ncbi:hypothetical protein J6590_039804 [Homalodisca vitripennis]|nr:hypothetical protein J6590_095620 [Homalodisca vitripennis]KAG8336723.1 hypothetical protein J6590_039804 [Homalodisca vitripennis]
MDGGGTEVFAPTQFIFYIANLPGTVSETFVYADDIALGHPRRALQTMVELLASGFRTLESFFVNWSLQLSIIPGITTFLMNTTMAWTRITVKSRDQ